MTSVRPATATAVADLARALGERVTASEAARRQHSHDESHHLWHLPDAVVSCASTDDVVAAVQICARHRAPVVPFGAGTGLESGATPVAGGATLDLAGLHRVLRVSADDLDATVQAGVTRLQLGKHLAGQGLFFPVDPGADASLGGMAATRASGTNSVRCGTMRENVLGLSAVLADGRVIRAGGRARKSAAGDDLTRLFVGSEGTLGVITEVTVRLYGIPETIAAAVRAFPDLRRAQQAGGTYTGEHGAGTGKTGFLRAEHGAGVDVMREIKTLLHPLGILNPGKVVPPDPNPGAGARPDLSDGRP